MLPCVVFVFRFDLTATSYQIANEHNKDYSVGFKSSDGNHSAEYS